jgi:hypothetical protein
MAKLTPKQTAGFGSLLVMAQTDERIMSVEMMITGFRSELGHVLF